jgi:hypothetical protein
MLAQRVSASGRIAIVLALLLMIPSLASAQATIVLINNDALGEGLNDPTPVAPVGGNVGTTLGEQRLNVLLHAAGIWGANLTSSVPIQVRASFDALSCSATSATPGTGGPVYIFRDFAGAPLAGTWYPSALADKLAGIELNSGEPDITLRMNVNVGQPGCLTGTPWYLGLDGNHGFQLDLVAYVLHYLAHGLGFHTTTNPTTGAQTAGYPNVFDHFVLDTTTGKSWPAMTNAERAASAVNPRRVVWTGGNVTASTGMLAAGTPQLKVAAPASVAAGYMVGEATFGPPLSAPGVTGEVMPVVPQLGGIGPGCDPFNAVNQAAVNGKVALIDRGICQFTIKVKNAQIAGAIGVIIADNVAGSPPGGMGGSDATITIPSVRITQNDANLLKYALRTRSRTHSGMFATIGIDLTRRRGADDLGRMLLYTPNPVDADDAIVHFDTSALPNLLMEPALGADLTQSLVPPLDLTLPLLRDIGW